MVVNAYLLHIGLGAIVLYALALMFSVQAGDFLTLALGDSGNVARSGTRMLAVGLFIVGLGILLLSTPTTMKIRNIEGLTEYLSSSLGLVLLFGGGAYLFGLYVVNSFRRDKLATATIDQFVTARSPGENDLRDGNRGISGRAGARKGNS